IEGNYLVIISYQADAKSVVTLKRANETFTLNVTSYDADRIISYKYQATSKISFRFSHDEREFQPDILIEELQRCAVYEDDSEGEWEIVSDLNIVSFNGQTPKSVFDAQDKPLCRTGIKAIITDTLPDGETVVQEMTFGDVLIAVKGDTTLSGMVQADDAAKILVYAAEYGSGQDARLYDSDDDIMEQFVRFLGNVDADSDINAEDAAYILIYAAQQGSGSTPDWDEITHTTDTRMIDIKLETK
ncbi:MAG: cellulose-binding protein CttA-related protein, partial [Oscillospiraceae bacterium]|nr:cellulose-binding protein CttA-related protein [Oscillospiraceae bacterium]